jgi:ferric-dicitrate binding protein FerR (iron transport regulator)
VSVDDELIDRFLDGEVSDDDSALVIEWLESSANLQRFAKRAELHADLRSSLRRRSIQDSAMETCACNVPSNVAEVVKTFGSSRRTAWQFSLRKTAIIALATAACLLVALMMRPEDTQPDSSHGQLATIVSEIDALLTNGESNWERAELVAGDYQLRRGLLHLQFDGGVMVYVEAPAQFNVVSSKRLVLQHGRLSASVPPEGIGFTVDTPEAEVVDFGTEFSVDVESGTSEVHVFDGLVRVQPRLTQSGVIRDAVDLRTSQAVKVNDDAESPIEIELASERFIRTFDEPKRKYARSLRRLSPLAFYRMAIRDKGLLSEPKQYSGEVLTGEGTRPPHARGVFAGGSLRIGADSTGRGGRVVAPPPLTTGRLTLAAFVYLETQSPGGTVATNMRGDDGSFALSRDENGKLQTTFRQRDGEIRSVSSKAAFPLQTWRHLVVTVDGDQMRLYEDGRLVIQAPCGALAKSADNPIWFGTETNGLDVWNGRIDELALFDKALSETEIIKLYQSALEETARSK